MARPSAVLGIFADADSAGRAVERLQALGVEEVEVLTGHPYPSGAFGEAPVHPRYHRFPTAGGLVGAGVGAALGVLLQAPPAGAEHVAILTLPPAAFLAILGGVLGGLAGGLLGLAVEAEARPAPYDPEITRGRIGVRAYCSPGQVGPAARALEEAGALRVRS